MTTQYEHCFAVTVTVLVHIDSDRPGLDQDPCDSSMRHEIRTRAAEIMHGWTEEDVADHMDTQGLEYVETVEVKEA
jgi:hypothetical protein